LIFIYNLLVPTKNQQASLPSNFGLFFNQIENYNI